MSNEHDLTDKIGKPVIDVRDNVIEKLLEYLEQNLRVPYGANKDYITIEHNDIYQFKFIQGVHEIRPIKYMKFRDGKLYLISGDFPKFSNVRKYSFWLKLKRWWIKRKYNL